MWESRLKQLLRRPFKIMKLFRIDRIIVALMALLVVFDGLLFWHIRAMQGQSAQHSSDIFRAPWLQGTSVVPVGLTSELERVVPVAAAGRGVAIRFASKNCKYCQQDTPLWNKMATALQQKGYQSIVLVPSAKDEYHRSDLVPAGAQQMAYVDIEWLSHLRLHATPLLLIFDSRGNLMWSHEGVLALSDLASAERMVGKKNQ
jgi:hypothetical protein